jgi:hypothetical protein
LKFVKTDIILPLHLLIVVAIFGLLEMVKYKKLALSFSVMTLIGDIKLMKNLELKLLI